MAQKVLIYHTDISKDATPDDKDVLDEAKFVLDNLKKLGYGVEQKPFNKCCKIIKKEIEQINPSFIFNLVEAIDGKDSLAYLAPNNFERLEIPYTGCTKRAFLDTKDKIDVKRELRKEGILTPYWLTLKELQREDIPKKKFLIKSRIDHASKNLEATLLEDKNDIRDSLHFKGENFFAEEYIDGREFNISMIGPLKRAEVLPFAEMKFVDWPSDKLKIVDYKAKWDEKSEEYNKTERNFEFLDSDKLLLKKIEEICRKCWDIFNLRGYARIDFRVDKDKRPYVLEVNVNPCISLDAGFIAAAHRAGMTDEEVIKNIIKDSCGEKFVL